jgi:RND family efflux transporter MFP subunit
MTSTTALAFWKNFSYRSGQWILLMAGVAGVSTLLLVFAGVFHPKVESTSTPMQRPIPPDALLAEVQQVTQPRFETAIGSIKPVQEADIASKILARVLEINVTAGKSVRAGDILVRLSSDEQQARVHQAEAELESIKAQYQLARTEFDRASRLIDSRSISKAEFDTARTRVQTTQANVDRAARGLEEAKVFLDFATVVAPFTGIVVDKVIEPGDTVTPGQTMLTLYDPSRMQLVVSVRESLASTLRVGQQLPAKLESLGYDCMAAVSEIVPKADVSSRSFEVKVSGPCPPGVYTGMFGRLMIPLEDQQVLLVPQAAIERVGQLELVHVAQDGELVRRSVQLGTRFSDQVEVLSGLRAGEKVMIRNSMGSKP